MKKVLATAAAFALLTGVSGCGSKGDSLMKEQISLLNQLADELEGSASQGKIDEISNKIAQNGRKLDELKLSQEDQKKLLEKHQEDWKKAKERFLAATMEAALSGKKIPELKFMK